MTEQDTQRTVELALEWVHAHRREKDALEAEITPDTNLLETGLLDSLAFVELLAHLEQTAGVEIDLLAIDGDDFSTIRGLCQASKSLNQ